MPPTKDVKKIINPETTAVKTLLALHLIHQGVATMGGRFFVLSAAHSKRDVDQTIKAFDSALDNMVAEGILKTNGR